jgi:uncharacterized protein HemX
MGRDKPLIDWDKLEDTEVENNLGWDDLKPGYKRPEDRAGAGSIAGAIILAAVIMVGGWVGYHEYKEYQVRQALAVAEQKLQLELERQKQAAARRRAVIAERNAAIEKRNQEAREVRAMNRRECRYWRGQYSKLKTPEIRTMVRKHC